MKELHLFYRISDKSYKKPRIPGASKEICLINFIKVFNEHWNNALIVADNCEEKTIELAQSFGTTEVTNLGNAGSFRHCLEKAARIKNEDAVVYFVEDDYIHMEPVKSPWIRRIDEMLFEGLESIEFTSGKPDYVTLQDHPDKYESMYGGGEISAVWRGGMSHWKQTTSTTMTFAARVKTIKEDLHIWQKYTEGEHPNDHEAFLELASQKKRKLVSPIPGVAVHCDVSSSEKLGLHENEKWVLDVIEKKLMSCIAETTVTLPKHPLQRLAVLSLMNQRKTLC